MAYKDGLYWREPEQDEDMRLVLVLDKQSREWTQAYQRIIPRLKKMGISILRRYYNWLDEKQVKDMVMDAITHLIMHGVYNPDKPKLYAYCGTVLKRYFHTKLIAEKNIKKNGRMVDDNYDINESPWIADNNPIQPDFEDLQSERQELLDEILAKIDTWITDVEAIVIKNVGNTMRNMRASGREIYGEKDIIQSESKEKRLCFLYTSREYFLEFFMIGRVSALSMADYIEARCDIESYITGRYQNHYFGAGAQPNKIDGRYIEQPEKSYLMDDDCPNYMQVNKSRKYANKKRVDDIDNYRYF